MLGRRRTPSVFIDSTDDTLVTHGSNQDPLKSGASDSASKAKAYSDTPARGYFWRNRQYDELRDDAAADSFTQRGDGSGGTGYQSDREAGAQRPAAFVAMQGQRSSSGSLAEGLFSRLTMKEKRNAAPTASDPANADAGVAGDITRTQPLPGATGGVPRRRAAAGAKAGAPAGRAPRAKKSRMHSTDAHYDGAAGFHALESDDEAGSHSSTERSGWNEDASPAEAPRPPTPGRPAEAPAPIQRASPSLMNTAAKLAASLQGPRRALTRRKSGEIFSLMDDSAAEAEAGSSGREGTSAPVQIRQEARTVSLGNPFAESASPGAARPLLDSADAYDDSGPASVGPAAARSAAGPAHPAAHETRGARPTLPRSSAGQPGRPLSGRLPARTRTRSEPVLNACQMEAAGADVLPGGIAASVAYDIFEPRTAPEEPAAPTPSPGLRIPKSQSSPASQPDIACMNGHEALKTLQRGTQLRKKWVNSPSPAAATQASKTERLIRCRIDGGKVVLHYHHQGVKGLLDKGEVVTHIQRVEVPDGPWRRGDCILLHTARGTLALEAPDAATHATWMLGLNAALVSVETRRRDVLLEAPARAIPRNSMFVVTPSQ